MTTADRLLFFVDKMQVFAYNICVVGLTARFISMCEVLVLVPTIH